jgi:hypothetical protein
MFTFPTFNTSKDRKGTASTVIQIKYFKKCIRAIIDKKNTIRGTKSTFSSAPTITVNILNSLSPSFF